jgi:NNP family nitrate/nitrite transporter-like MFS transporter
MSQKNLSSESASKHLVEQKPPFEDPDRGARRKRALTLATTAFAVSFALWGLLAGLMPIIKNELALSSFEASLLASVPVILGALGRIPMGFLADRYGPRRVFVWLLFATIVPVAGIGLASNYTLYLLSAAFLGIAGTSFAVGVTYVSRWYPAHEQGTALGIFGAGNIGQSVAVFGAPALAFYLGLSWTVWLMAVLAFAFALLFRALSEEPAWDKPPVKLSATLKNFFGQTAGWVLSTLYFSTFGGFVALAIYMPLLLKDMFDMTPLDAGFRTAMFIVVATAARPLGGYLSDRMGAVKMLGFVFAALVPCAFFMTLSDLGYFSIGALLAAALMGVGNGAVFKLVPSFFPESVGAATGMVGAAGGMGGFFPPLLLGYSMDVFASYAPAFYAMACFSLFCLLLLRLTVARK